MPVDGEEIYLSQLELDIMRSFFNTVYLTDTEMAEVLRTLADKLDGQWKKRVGFSNNG